MKPESIRLCLNNSFCLGLYIDRAAHHPPALATPPAPEQIGFVRMITDYTTFGFITDVYIAPEYRGKRLGKWLIEVINEVIGGMKDLRRAMLVAGEEEGREFYEKELGFSKVEQGRGGLCLMHRLGEGATARLM